MTCNEVIDFLADYLDGTLSWRQRVVFNLHLALCRDCRRYLVSYAETLRLTQALRHRPAKDVQAAPEELIQAILAARHAGQGPTNDDPS